MRVFGRIVIAVVVIASFIAAAYFYLSVKESAPRQDIDSQVISSSSRTGLLSPSSLAYEDVLLIHAEDSYTMTFTDNDRPPIGRRISVGQEVLFGVSLADKKMIDPEAVKVIVTSNDGEQQLPVVERQKDNRVDYEVRYVPERPGEYLISVGIEGAGYGGKMKVVVFDPSLISDTSFSASDLLVDFGSLGIAADAVRVIPAHRGESSSGGPFWDIDTPGYLEAAFGDDLTGKGVLKIYSLVVYKGFVGLPEFYEHIVGLDTFLSGKNISKQEKTHLVAFPPINASLGGFSHEKMISSSFFDGWRYVHHGRYQAVDFPNGVKYIFQGLSKDRKFFVYFEREVNSVELEKLKKKTKECFPDDKEHSCVNKAFLILQNANDFSPELSSLDSFVQTIKMKD